MEQNLKKVKRIAELDVKPTHALFDTINEVGEEIKDSIEETGSDVRDIKTQVLRLEKIVSFIGEDVFEDIKDIKDTVEMLKDTEIEIEIEIV